MVNPLSYFSFQPVIHDWCNKCCGMFYPVCGMVHIREPLLLIGKSSLCGGSGFPFMLSSTHFLYGYMASDIWLRTILIVRKETRCRHIGYSYQLTARVLLYAPSHRQDNTYNGLCYTSHGALAGTRNSSMGPPHYIYIHIYISLSFNLPYIITMILLFMIYFKTIN